MLNLEPIQNDSLLVDQGHDNGVSGSAMALVANGGSLGAGLGFNNSGVAVESSYWFVKSDQLGKVSVGKQSSAADNQAILPDGSGTLVVANYVMFDVNNFGIRNKNRKLVLRADLGLDRVVRAAGRRWRRIRRLRRLSEQQRAL